MTDTLHLDDEILLLAPDENRWGRAIYCAGTGRANGHWPVPIEDGALFLQRMGPKNRVYVFMLTGIKWAMNPRDQFFAHAMQMGLTNDPETADRVRDELARIKMEKVEKERAWNRARVLEDRFGFWYRIWRKFFE